MELAGQLGYSLQLCKHGSLELLEYYLRVPLQKKGLNHCSDIIILAAFNQVPYTTGNSHFIMILLKDAGAGIYIENCAYRYCSNLN